MLRAKQRGKIGMDVEALVRWAYVDELSKRQSSAAEGIWDHILDYQNHGGIDSGQGAAQRYAHFGLPDADAERVERAISGLGDTVIDWNKHFDDLAGDLAGLISVNDLSPHREYHRPKVGWGNAGKSALRAFFGDKGVQPLHDRRRDVLMVGGIKTNTLITMHAIKGTRPDWHSDDPYPQRVPSHGRGGTTAAVVGECRGKNLYSTGSYCPLEWSPSPLTVVTGRMEYFTWYQGLIRLTETLLLEKFEALAPKAPALPWVDNSEWISRMVPVMPTGRNNVSDWGTLPLKPVRPRAGPPRRREKGVGRYIAPEL